MKKSYKRIIWSCFTSVRIDTSSSRAASSSSESFLRFTHLTANGKSLCDRWKPSRTVEKAPVPSYRIFWMRMPQSQFTYQTTDHLQLLSIDTAHRSASHWWNSSALTSHWWNSPALTSKISMAYYKLICLFLKVVFCGMRTKCFWLFSFSPTQGLLSITVSGRWRSRGHPSGHLLAWTQRNNTEKSVR